MLIYFGENLVQKTIYRKTTIEILMLLEFLYVVITVVLLANAYGQYKSRSEAATQGQTLKSMQAELVEVRQFTNKLDSSPQFRGSVGEDVVRQCLAILPGTMVHEQYSSSEIPGRPDFVIEAPNVADLLVIDAKFIVHDENFPITKNIQKRAAEITKYIVPGVTFDFVVMWIPEHAYFAIDDATLLRLSEMRVVPTTTKTLMGLVFLALRTHKAFQLNERASEYYDFKETMGSLSKQSLGVLKTTISQVTNASNNLSKVKDIVERAYNEASL